MAVSLSRETGSPLGRPKPLFEADLLPAGGDFGGYDVSADGLRFLTVAPVKAAHAEAAKIHLVENWHEEFRDRGQD